MRCNVQLTFPVHDLSNQRKTSKKPQQVTYVAAGKRQGHCPLNGYGLDQNDELPSKRCMFFRPSVLQFKVGLLVPHGDDRNPVGFQFGKFPGGTWPLPKLIHQVPTRRSRCFPIGGLDAWAHACPAYRKRACRRTGLDAFAEEISSMRINSAKLHPEPP